jgi:hypothetical protein
MTKQFVKPSAEVPDLSSNVSALSSRYDCLTVLSILKHPVTQACPTRRLRDDFWSIS